MMVISQLGTKYISRLQPLLHVTSLY